MSDFPNFFTVFFGLFLNLFSPLPPLSPEEMCLAMNIYFETASSRYPEPPFAQEMVGYVTQARADENKPEWGGSTICGVVFKKHLVIRHGRRVWVHEFSWTGHPDRVRAKPHGWRWDGAVRVAKKIRAGWKPQGVLVRARYYNNPEYSDPKILCELFGRRLVYLDKVGKHEFFAKPSKIELQELEEDRVLGVEPAVCKDHTIWTQHKLKERRLAVK